MKRNQSGFTLIEIAIVLVIIGLLLGGVLKGQELINSARVKNMATDFRNIPVYIYGYQDKFHALPGDDKDPVTHLGAPVTLVTPTAGQTLGNGLIEGPWLPTAVTDETLLFWQHIRVAGLATGSTTLPTAAAGISAFLPSNSAGGVIGIQSGTNIASKAPITDSSGAAIRGSYIICSDGILGKFVKQLDTQMDDGKTDSGSMMAVPTGAALDVGTQATPTTGATGISDSATYTVCMGV
jgi:prepilin-type N-terminal cleavage/methylation domain-containing protein